MSLVYGVLDTRMLQFSYSDAGHSSPLLRDGAVLSLDCGGMLLGVVDQVEDSSETIDLQPHDVMVCYSDGISEARNADEQLFGRDGIARALRSAPHQHDSVQLLNRV